jgi:hypothetical protein
VKLAVISSAGQQVLEQLFAPTLWQVVYLDGFKTEHNSNSRPSTAWTPPALLSLQQHSHLAAGAQVDGRATSLLAALSDKDGLHAADTLLELALEELQVHMSSTSL